MKIRNPKSRNHIKVPKHFNVLEVGGGHNPHQRSNTIVDKFIESNYHRSGDIKINKNQKFMEADGENLPFENNKFDSLISTYPRACNLIHFLMLVYVNPCHFNLESASLSLNVSKLNSLIQSS